MIRVVVLMVTSSLYFKVIITSLFMIQQKLSRVCRRTNNYFVALLCASMSSFLLQKAEVYASCEKITPHMECF